MRLVTGSYTGNGTGQSITGVGFAPTAVFVFRSESGVAMEIQVKTSAMAGALSVTWTGSGDANDGITSLDSGGFTVGAGVTANKNTITYHYAAFQTGSNDFAVGTYSGNVTDNRDIPVGFQPDIVTVWRQGAGAGRVAQWWTATKGGDNTYALGLATGFTTNRIQGVGATTFQVGDDATVNNSGSTIFWMAWKNTSVTVYEGSLTGNATLDDRNIAYTDPFLPKLVLHIFPENSGSNIATDLWRFDTFSGDQTFQNGQTTIQTNRIQALNASGHQVGNDRTVNSHAGWTASNLYYYVAWTDGSPPPSDYTTAASPTKMAFPDVLPHWYGYTVRSY